MRPHRPTRPAAVLVPLAATVGATLLLGACATPVISPGAERTETRDATGVHAVRLAVIGDLVVEEGPEPSLTVTAGENVIGRIDTRVDDGVLTIDMERTAGNVGTPRYELVVPELTEVGVDGAGRADVHGVDPGPEGTLGVVVQGAGDLWLHDVEVDTLEVRVDGAGAVIASGRADRQTVEIHGAGDYEGQGLTTREATVRMDGAGDARVDVTDVLDVEVDGAGGVRYSGGADVHSRVSGVGTVEEAD